jgi:hypothetical protein
VPFALLGSRCSVRVQVLFRVLNSIVTALRALGHDETLVVVRDSAFAVHG